MAEGGRTGGAAAASTAAARQAKGNTVNGLNLWLYKTTAVSDKYVLHVVPK